MNRHFMHWVFPVLVGAMPSATPSATKAEQPLVFISAFAPGPRAPFTRSNWI